MSDDIDALEKLLEKFRFGWSAQDVLVLVSSVPDAIARIRELEAALCEALERLRYICKFCIDDRRCVYCGQLHAVLAGKGGGE